MTRERQSKFSISRLIASSFEHLSKNFIKIIVYFIAYSLLVKASDFVITNTLFRIIGDTNLTKILDFTLSNLVSCAFFLGFLASLINFARNKKTELSIFFEYFNLGMLHLFAISLLVTGIGYLIIISL